MKYLVTGGAGFIGGHLVDRLLDDGNEVVVVDNLSTGKLDNLRRSLNLQFFEADISDRKDLKSVFDEVRNVDYVFNLAAIVSVPYSFEHEEETMRVNYEALKNIVEFSRKHSVKGIVQAGSSAEYGDVREMPIREEFANNETEQLSPYGRSKYLATKYLLENNSPRFKTAVTRFFNVYGERQDPKSPYSGVISIFFDRVINGENLSVFGDGMQTRDFVYVGDVVNGLIAASKSSGIFNIGTGKTVTVKELAEKVIDLSGKELEVQYLEQRDGDILHSRADISKTLDKLGWWPSMRFDDGLRRTYEWYLGNR